MKSRLIMLMSLAIAALSVTLAAGRINYTTSVSPPAHATLAPSKASYLGVFEGGTPVSYQLVSAFARAAGRKPNLVGYFSGWAEAFDTGFAQTLHRNGAIPLVQIDPTGASVAAIAAGDYDDYLRSYADAVRTFRYPVVIGFGHEMNASWYPWGSGHVEPATFVAAWQHLVTLFRQQGADNVTWLWTVQADLPGSSPLASWWPGSRYVTWVGIDGFYYRQSDSFASVFGRTVRQVRALTRRPMLLSETAVGPEPNQFAKIQDLFRGMAADKMLGLVWFDIAQHAGVYHQDWRIENSEPAEVSFKLGVREDLAPASGGT